MVLWLTKTWWVIAFCLVMAICYLQAAGTKLSVISQLEARALELEEEKKEALIAKEELELRIASQSDPAWIELVLLREVGVVPEGYLKVHFKK